MITKKDIYIRNRARIQPNSVDPTPGTLKVPEELPLLTYTTSASINIFRNTETVKLIHLSTVIQLSTECLLLVRYCTGIRNRDVNKAKILMGLMNSQLNYWKDVSRYSLHYCVMKIHGEIFFLVPRLKIIMLLLSNLLIFTFWTLWIIVNSTTVFLFLLNAIKFGTKCVPFLWQVVFKMFL